MTIAGHPDQIAFRTSLPPMTSMPKESARPVCMKTAPEPHDDNWGDRGVKTEKCACRGKHWRDALRPWPVGASLHLMSANRPL